jgi:uncharacterized membrane protein YdfJ with MMPL/SSD domain
MTASSRVSRTGRLVTSTALTLFFALASLSLANDPTGRQIAAGVGVGVLLDAIVRRILLLPALVSLFGNASWWMLHGRCESCGCRNRRTPRCVSNQSGFLYGSGMLDSCACW